MGTLEILLTIAIAVALFAFGMGLGAWMENVRLTSLHLEESLSERITQEFKIQNEYILAATEMQNDQESSTPEDEEDPWSNYVGSTQPLPIVDDHQRD
tara:strand:- start:14595 stop:14888 length:294 start_codon:yes stop_codon:yes gene_type:complete